MYEEADIHDLKNDDLLLFKYLCGCTNHKLRKELLKNKEPAVKKVDDLILTWEISKRADKEVAKTAKAASVQPHKGGRKTTPRGKMPSQTPEHQAFLKWKGKQDQKNICIRCRGGGHTSSMYQKSAKSITCVANFWVIFRVRDKRRERQ